MAEQNSDRLQMMHELMGDTDNNGVVSARELMAALTNGKEDAIDMVAQAAFAGELQRYTMLSAMTKSDKVKREAARETRANLEAISERLFQNLGSVDTGSDPDAKRGQEIISSVRRIEIPRDIDALAKAVVGENGGLFVLPQIQDLPEDYTPEVPLPRQNITRNDTTRGVTVNA